MSLSESADEVGLVARKNLWYSAVGGDGMLRELRLKAGLTQIELSTRSGVNVRQIQRVELGTSKIENVTLANAKKLADALGVGVEDLLEKGSP